MEKVIVVLIFVAIVAVGLVIRHGINRLADKAGDAVSNAITRKKNTKTPPKTENLADQYKQK